MPEETENITPDEATETEQATPAEDGAPEVLPEDTPEEPEAPVEDTEDVPVAEAPTMDNVTPTSGDSIPSAPVQFGTPAIAWGDSGLTVHIPYRNQ